jgi:hypothetical protein
LRADRAAYWQKNAEMAAKAAAAAERERKRTDQLKRLEQQDEARTAATVRTVVDS